MAVSVNAQPDERERCKKEVEKLYEQYKKNKPTKAIKKPPKKCVKVVNVALVIQHRATTVWNK